MNIFYYTIILFAFLANAAIAQENKCVYCNKEIKSAYINVDGKYYHAEHFKCYECDKAIEGEYSKSEGRYFHSECYFNEILPKCDVCIKPLDGEFYTDVYDKKYHKHHLSDNKHCDNCNRLAAQRITNGGRQLDDGRYLCNICNRSALKTESQYKRLLESVKNRLNNLGVRISANPISIYSVDQTEMNSISGTNSTDKLRGFCEIESRHTQSNGNETVSKKYTIYVLNNLPSIYTETTIAHELMHIWLHENTDNDHDEELEEGSCHYISYLFLNTIRAKEAGWIIKLMKNDQNEIYGGGFRKVLNIFDRKPLTKLLTFLKENKQL